MGLGFRDLGFRVWGLCMAVLNMFVSVLGLDIQFLMFFNCTIGFVLCVVFKQISYSRITRRAAALVRNLKGGTHTALQSHCLDHLLGSIHIRTCV